jgi:hypothetical protein
MRPSFNGVAAVKRKVDLRGRSGEEAKSKEVLLQEARREREARAQHKAQTQGATRIQVRRAARSAQ